MFICKDRPPSLALGAKRAARIPSCLQSPDPCVGFVLAEVLTLFAA